jgi:starch synthase
MALHRLGRDLEMRQWNSPLNSTLNFEDLEMEIDGRRELRLLRSNGAQFGRFPGFRSGTPGRASRGISHHEIISRVRILMVASEVHPFAKTGGLADVLGALPRALAKLGHDVDVVMPHYRGITVGSPVGQISVSLGGQVDVVDVSAVIDHGVRIVFIAHPGYFDRDYLYGASSRDYPDNPERFAFLSQAALTWAASTGHRYDIVHAHDWQAGLVPLMIQRTIPAWRGTAGPATVFTIHNLAYQGIFDASWLPRLGFGWDLMRVDALEYWNRISYLKAGVVFSRLITTVSPRYAQEIQTPELGFGFDGILRARSGDLVGILNGIDYDQWDPERDLNLPVPFNASKITGKAAAKRRVLEAFGLSKSPESRHRPLVAMISRMVDQKGFDLLDQIADALPALSASFVLLGSGEPRYEAQWRGLAVRHPGRIGARIGFDDGLAHLMEGGADIFLMPSRFEPCGLNQMYSLRYGTVPVVRATGGLFDTVHDVDENAGRGTGFTFTDYSPVALLRTLGRALEMFENRPAWRRIQRAGMREDFSWDASAREYVKVYERAVAANRAGAA